MLNGPIKTDNGRNKMKYLFAALFFAVFIISAATYSIANPKSCLKPDGDWLDGVTKRECKSICNDRGMCSKWKRK